MTSYPTTDPAGLPGQVDPASSPNRAAPVPRSATRTRLVRRLLPMLLTAALLLGLPLSGTTPLPARAETSSPVPAMSTSFETDTAGWTGRADARGSATVGRVSNSARTGRWSAAVRNRTSQGQGLQRDLTGVLTGDRVYRITAWVKLGTTTAQRELDLSLATTSSGRTDHVNLARFGGLDGRTWRQVSHVFTLPVAEQAVLYWETPWAGGAQGDTSPFWLDDVAVTDLGPVPDAPVTASLADTLDVPLGVAVDQRDLVGRSGELVQQHFNQLSAENHLKPEAWYDDQRRLTIDPEAAAILDVAAREQMTVHGHTLVWYRATPEWFFTDEQGRPLTDAPADQQLLRERLRSHVFGVAEQLSAWGPFGDGNPVVSFDVVNEAISDGPSADGLRDDRWHQVLGEEYLDLALTYADEAFNSVYAAPGAQRPVRLLLNDYDTHLPAKRERLVAVLDRLQQRGVPVDGVGHQFHVGVRTPVSMLESAISELSGRGLTQAVTELDVTLDRAHSEAALVDQGYYYRDVFAMLRKHSAALLSVSVWGLHDGRSWIGAEHPLLLDAQLQPKPALRGALGEPLPPRLRSSVRVPLASRVPVIDGKVDALWSGAASVGTDELVLGDDETATAKVRMVWTEGRLHLLAEVTDEALDTTSPEVWQQDSLEIFLDAGNRKSSTFTATDAQLRVNAANQRSYGPGDAKAQQARLSSATVKTATGWRLEASITLTGASAGSSHGLELLLNDAAAGQRTGARGWANPLGDSWASPAGWGTVHLVR